MGYTKQSQKYFDALQEMLGFNQQISNSGKLTKSELNLIAAIGKYMDRPKGVKSSDLSRELKVTTAAISKMLRVLEKKGLIERNSDEDDRRVVYVRLTYAGNDAFLASVGEREDLLEQVFQRMGREEVDQFLELWGKFNRLMAEEHKKMQTRKRRERDDMKAVFVEGGALSFTAAEVLERMGLPRDHSFGASLAPILAQASTIAKPKAFYLTMKIEKRTESTVTIGGQTFYSAVLSKLLTGVSTVYPYLCTCGQELVEYANQLDDMLAQYALDAIMEMYRQEILAVLRQKLENTLTQPGPTIAVDPGDLADWPIYEQKKLFALFDDAAEKVGVTLSDSCLMYPVKSVSGLRYQAEELLQRPTAGEKSGQNG